MRPDFPPGRTVSSALTNRLGIDATAAQIAATFGELVRDIGAAMTPVVGARGVDALGQRCLHLARAAHPWLASGPPGELATLGDAALAGLIAQRHRDEAGAAATCLLQTFWDLLASLIGASLTERLLRPVWGPESAPASNSATAQDPPP